MKLMNMNPRHSMASRRTLPLGIRRDRRTTNLHVTVAATLALALISGGCAGPARPAPDAPRIDERKAHLTLEQIPPAVALPDEPPAVTSLPTIPAAAERYLRTGRDRFEDELWGEAINELSKALQIAPDFVEARILLSRASLLQGNIPLARTHLEELLKVRPRDVAIHQLLGDIAWQSRQVDEAILSLRRALMCPNATPDRPETIVAHLVLGLALHEAGYLRAAADQLQAFLTAIEKTPPPSRGQPELRQMANLYRSRVLTSLGEIYDVLGRTAEAVATLRRGIALAPGDRELRVRLARVLARGGQSGEALQPAREMCLSDDDASAGLELLADVAERSGGPRCVATELMRLSEASRHPGLLLHIAERLAAMKLDRETATVLRRVVELQPTNSEARTRLAELSRKLGNDREFLDGIIDVISVHKDGFERTDALITGIASDTAERRKLIALARECASGEDRPKAAALLVLGRLLMLDGQIDEAARVLEESAEADPTLGAAHVNLAEVRLSRRMWQPAIAACEKALRAGVREAALYAIKARAHEAMDEKTESEKAYNEAIRLAPRNDALLFEYAQLLMERGKNNLAIPVLLRITREANPKNVEAREALIRAYLVGQNVGAAQLELTELRRVTGDPNAGARIAALLRLATDGSTPGPIRLRTYRDALTQLLSERPTDVLTAIDLAHSHEATQDYDEAVRVLDRVLASRPEDIRLRELKSKLLAKLLRFDEAIALVQSLLSERPRTSRWLHQLAELAMDSDDFALAAESYRTLLRRDDLSEEHPRLRLALINALEQSEDADAALAAAREWYEADRTDGRARSVYVRELQRAGRTDDAIATIERWLKDAPTDAGLRRLLIDLLEETMRHADAQARILDWMRDNPTDEGLQRLLISTLLAAKDWDAALELVQASMEVPSLREDYEQILVRVYELAERFEDAVDEMQRITRGRRESALELDLLRVLIRAKRFGEAERVAERLIAPHQARMNANVPFDVNELSILYRQLATIYQSTGRLDQCIEMLEKIYEFLPNDPGINNDLGYTLADAGRNIERAEVMVRFAVGEEPRNAAFLDSFGWVLYKQGRLDESIRFLRKAIRRSDATDAVIHDHYGDALYRSGDRDAARKQWQRAVEIARDNRRSLSAEDDDVLERATAKLKSLERGEPCGIAPLAKPDLRPQDVPGTDASNAAASKP